jgi:hypothetical protein
VVSIGTSTSYHIIYRVYENSYAHTWVLENGLTYELIT